MDRSAAEPRQEMALQHYMGRINHPSKNTVYAMEQGRLPDSIFFRCRGRLFPRQWRRPTRSVLSRLNKLGGLLPLPDWAELMDEWKVDRPSRLSCVEGSLAEGRVARGCYRKAVIDDAAVPFSLPHPLQPSHLAQDSSFTAIARDLLADRQGRPWPPVRGVEHVDVPRPARSMRKSSTISPSVPKSMARTPARQARRSSMANDGDRGGASVFRNKPLAEGPPVLGHAVAEVLEEELHVPP